MNTFTLCTRSSLKFYVYLLISPINKRIFYVGKGENNRVFQHANAAIKETDKQSDKLDVIRKLLAAETPPQISIVRHGLTESEALLLEASLIDLLRFMEHEAYTPIMTNIVAGHDSSLFGLRSPKKLEALYATEKLDTIEPCILIKINKSKTERNLYDATRMAWKVNPARAQKARYGLAVYEGVVLEMFSINGWYPCPEIRPGRWAFEGEVEKNDCLRAQHVGKVVQDIFPKGAANPIRYLNIP